MTVAGSGSLSVAVLGATGLLGAEIVRVLDAAPWRPARLVPLSSGRSSTTHVDWGEDRVVVDDLSDQALGEVDLVILAAPSAVSLEAGRDALKQGVSVVDCSGALAAELPVLVPWITPELLPRLERGAVIPAAPALLVASIVAPLRRLGVDAPVSATVMLPASTAGRAGLDELSKQVVGLLNGSAPPRKVFEGGLAFDLVPTVGTVTPGGWTTRERDVAALVLRLTGGEAAIDVTLVQVPVFSGMAAAIHLMARVPVDKVREALEASGLVLSETRSGPRPRRMDGLAFPHVGRVRAGADGSVHLWVAMDNLRCVATAAVHVAGALLARSGALQAPS